MEISRFKSYAPRIGFTFLVFFALTSSIREFAYALYRIDIGFGSLNYEISFVIFSIIFIASIWFAYGFITQLASSLGYRKTKEEGFVITGDGNIIHLGEKEEKQTNNRKQSHKLEVQLYENDAPLRALQQSRIRLLEHISGLRNSSIFNLFIGIAIAAIGIATIGTTFFEIEKYSTAGKGFDATNFLLFVLLPRLSIALIVQVFSFFFLLMYRSNVQDVRYFQNEITNIDLIAAGVSFIKGDGDPNTKSTITALLKTERNRIISKNQKMAVTMDDDAIMRKLMTIDSKISKLPKKSQINSED